MRKAISVDIETYGILKRIKEQTNTSYDVIILKSIELAIESLKSEVSDAQNSEQ